MNFSLSKKRYYIPDNKCALRGAKLKVTTWIAFLYQGELSSFPAFTLHLFLCNKALPTSSRWPWYEMEDSRYTTYELDGTYLISHYLPTYDRAKYR
jgi:hypothetical protein